MEIQYVEVINKKQTIRIPYIEFAGRESGPHMFISGGMHGNEVNGIAIVKEILEWLKKKNMQNRIKGKITVLPILNVSGFMRNIRRVPEDNADLNRAFNADNADTLSKKIAKTLIKEIFAKCDFGVDFHDAGKGATLLPHVRIHKNDDLRCVSCSRGFAQIFGTKIILERQGDPGMLAVALQNDHNIPVITVEVGGERVAVHQYHGVCIDGIKNLLISQGMIDGTITVPEEQFILYGRYGIRAPTAAFIQIDAALGDTIHKGDRIGTMYDPVTVSSEEIVSPMCGLLFSKRMTNLIRRGGIAYSVLEYAECHTKRTTLDKFESLPEVDITKMTL